MKNNVLMITLPQGMNPNEVQFELSATKIAISAPVVQFDTAHAILFSSVASRVAKDDTTEESDEDADEESCGNRQASSGIAIGSGSTHDTGYNRVQLWLDIYRENYTNGIDHGAHRSNNAEYAANLAIEAFDRKFS